MHPAARDWLNTPTPIPSTAPEPDAFYGVVVALGIFGGGLVVGALVTFWWMVF